MNRFLTVTVLALAVGVTGVQAQQKGPQPKSQKELEAIQEIFKATDPDAKIKAADNLITKFADTEFKGLALAIMADSYRMKRDYENTVIYGERALEADPKNYEVMLMLSGEIAARTRENDLDKEEKLAKAEKYAKSALDLLKDVTKPNPNVTDEQWAAYKKDALAQGHQALGLVAMARKKYDVAITEFKTAVDSASKPDPATMVRLGAAYNQAGKYDDAIAVLDKVMADPETSAQIKQFAQAEKVRATQAKAGGSKTPSTSATPQVEIKKQ